MAERFPTDVAYGRRLFAAFAGLVLAFVGSTIFTSWRSSRIETEAHELVANALPSIEYLVKVVNLVRDLEAKCDDFPDLAADRRDDARAEIERDRRTIDVTLTKYLALPMYEGERLAYSEVPVALRRLDAAITRLFDQVAASDLATARLTADHEVRTSATHAANLVDKVVELNASHAYTAVASIESTRIATSRTALVLDALSIVVGLVAAAWLWGLFRAHARLLRLHGEIVERRADELELFGRRVAHDLLSPLSALTYCLAAFKRASESDPALKDALARARACVRRAQTMVDGIFEFARSGGRPDAGARVDVGEVVRQVVEEIAEVDAKDRAEVVVEPFEPRAVACSRGVLMSVLSNLARNAVKFMSDSSLKRLTIRVLDRPGGVRIEVEDTGPGVPPGIEEAIFEPYVRADGVTQPGLGLGLATVKRLCEAHGGSASVRSTGHGAVFAVTLPSATDEVAAPPESVKMMRGASGA